MRIVALDPSTTAVGFCYGQDDVYIFGFQRTYRGQPEERLRAIFKDLLLYTEMVEVIAVEIPTGNHANRRTDRALSEVVGMIRALAYMRGQQLIFVYPAQAKAALGHGSNDKDQMIHAASLVTGRQIEGEHHADAIGIWLAALGKLQTERIYQLANITP